MEGRFQFHHLCCHKTIIAPFTPIADWNTDRFDQIGSRAYLILGGIKHIVKRTNAWNCAQIDRTGGNSTVGGIGNVIGGLTGGGGGALGGLAGGAGGLLSGIGGSIAGGFCTQFKVLQFTWKNMLYKNTEADLSFVCLERGERLHQPEQHNRCHLSQRHWHTWER